MAAATAGILLFVVCAGSGLCFWWFFRGEILGPELVPLQNAMLRTIWMSPYFRGALSGLGLVNIYIGLGELGRQMCRGLFSRKGQVAEAPARSKSPRKQGLTLFRKCNSKASR